MKVEFEQLHPCRKTNARSVIIMSVLITRDVHPNSGSQKEHAHASRIAVQADQFTMQVSRSLADFMDRLDAGPRGAADALERIEECSEAKSSLLDLQQMKISDNDLQTIMPSLGKLADHVTELNLFMNE